MKYLFLLFILTGCAHTKFDTFNGTPLKLCNTLTYVYSDPALNDKRKFIGLSAHYWGEATGIMLLSYHGDTQRFMTDPLDSVIVYLKDEDDGKLSSRELLISKSRNCIVGAKIYIRESVLADDDMLQTILRKEFGFTLGLKATSDFTDVMYYSYEPTLQDPVDANEETINALRSAYSE